MMWPMVQAYNHTMWGLWWTQRMRAIEQTSEDNTHWD